MSEFFRAILETGLYDPGLPGPLPLDAFLLLLARIAFETLCVFAETLELCIFTVTFPLNELAEDVRILLDGVDPDLKDLTGDATMLDVP